MHYITAEHINSLLWIPVHRSLPYWRVKKAILVVTFNHVKEHAGA